MPNLKAESTAEHAFDQLSALLQDVWGPIDEFTLARLEAAANNGMSTDPVQAHQVLAIVAAVRWNDAAMDKHFGIAMRLDAGTTVEENYAATLIGVERWVEGAIVYERAANENPADLSILRSAMQMNWRAGRWERSLAIAEVLKQRAPNEQFEHLAMQQQLVECAKRIGLSLAQVEALHTATYRYLHDQRVRSCGYRFDIDDTPGDETLHVIVDVPASYEEVERLDDALTPLLFDAVALLPLASFHIQLGARETSIAAGERLNPTRSAR